MSTEIYLGYPPENIKKWIKENYKPAFKLTDPLCFTAEEAGSTVKMSKYGSAPTVYLETSPTGEEGTWTEFFVDETIITLSNVGDKVYFRAKQDNERFATNYIDYNYFVMTGKIAASGNLNTLLKADGSVLDLTGRDYCYSYMFENCPSLTKAPVLPATTLADGCYYDMFVYCTSLTQAPKLPATTLANGCYFEMFFGCTSLTQVSFPNLEEQVITSEIIDSMHIFAEISNQITIISKDGIFYWSMSYDSYDTYQESYVELYYDSYMSYVESYYDSYMSYVESYYDSYMSYDSYDTYIN